jgi:hypothetical protein
MQSFIDGSNNLFQGCTFINSNCHYEASPANAEAASTNKGVEARIAATKKEHKAEVDALKFEIIKFDNGWEKTKEDHEHEIWALKEDHEREMQILKEAHSAKLDALRIELDIATSGPARNSCVSQDAAQHEFQDPGYVMGYKHVPLDPMDRYMAGMG